MAFVGLEAMHLSWACTLISLAILVAIKPRLQRLGCWLMLALINDFAMFQFVVLTGGMYT